MRNPQGNEVPFWAKRLAHWPDGSVKWLFLSFLADFPDGGSTTYRLNYGPQVVATASGPHVQITDSADRLIVETGAACFVFSKTDAKLVQAASICNGSGQCEEPLITGLAPFMVLEDPDGHDTELSTVVTAVAVEESGPFRAAVRIDAEARGGSRPFWFTLRFYAYAGSPLLRIFFTFVHTGDPQQEYIQQIGLKLDASSAYFSDYALGVLDNASATGLLAGPMSAIQDRSDHFTLGDGLEGERLAGWLNLGGARGSVVVSVRRLHQLYPKGFGVEPSTGQVTVWLWPPQGEPLRITRKPGQTSEGESTGTYPDQELGQPSSSIGVAKTHELMLYLHPSTNGPGEVASVAAAFDRPPLPFVSAQWNARSGVLGAIGLKHPDAFEAAETGVALFWEFLLFNQQSEPWFGAMDYGDMQNCFLYPVEIRHHHV